MNRLSKHLLKELPVNVTNRPDILGYDLIGLMDTNSIQQLNDYEKKITNMPTPILLIDHHGVQPKTTKIAQLSIINEQVSSTCELVYTFFREMKIKPNQNVATAIFLGMACDSRHFLLSRASTFKAVSELIDWGVDVNKSLSLLFLPSEYSERMARLKAVKRSEVHRIGEWISVSSIISSYQASVAKALIALGADIAVAVGWKDGELIMCLRSAIRFWEKTGINLGKQIAVPLGAAVKGVGGGHPTAAGVNGKSTPDKALLLYNSLLKEVLTSDKNKELPNIG
jgi:nanoRNase/pAp phosphatase (c-di-AMP/oligoRNAs hydrolase)